MSTIGTILFFFVAVLAAKCLGMVQAFLVAKFLGPEDFGVWITMLLIVSYGPILCMGTVETLLKEVPFHLGRNDPKAVRKIEDIVMGSILLSATIVLAATAVLYVLPPSLSIRAYVRPIGLVLIATAVTYFSGYFYHRLAAYEQFNLVGFLDAFRAVAALFFIGILGWLQGLYGVALGYLLHEATTCLLALTFNLRYVGKLGVRIERTALIRAIWVGLPITLVWWFVVLQNTVDRVVLGSFLGQVAVGEYGLGLSIVTTLGLLPMVVGRVLYPQVNKQYGIQGGANAMKRLVIRPSLSLGILLANTQLALIALTPFIYHNLLVKYQAGLVAGQILIVGAYPACLLRNGGNYLIACNQQWLFVKYTVGSILFNALVNVLFVHLGFGISGVALGTSFASLLLTTLVWRRTLQGLGLARQELWGTLALIYLPFVVVSLLVYGISVLAPRCLQRPDWITASVFVVLLVLLNSLLFLSPTHRDEVLKWRSALQHLVIRFKTAGIEAAQ